MRLTKKIKEWNSISNTEYDDYTFLDHSRVKEAVTKMGQIEDLEEKLGIDAVTFIQSMINVLVYVINGDKIEQCAVNLDKGIDNRLYFCSEYDTYYIEDYGKTWARTKEELEVLKKKIKYCVYEKREDEYNATTSSVRTLKYVCDSQDAAHALCEELARKAWGHAYYWVEPYYEE